MVNSRYWTILSTFCLPEFFLEKIYSGEEEKITSGSLFEEGGRGVCKVNRRFTFLYFFLFETFPEVFVSQSGDLKWCVLVLGNADINVFLHGFNKNKSVYILPGSVPDQK